MIDTGSALGSVSFQNLRESEEGEGRGSQSLSPLSLLVLLEYQTLFWPEIAP